MDKIFSSEIARACLLLEPAYFGTEFQFYNSKIFAKVDIFSIDSGSYVKFESASQLEECKQKVADQKGSRLCTYVIFDGRFRLEIAYRKSLLFYASLEKYSPRPSKGVFIDDAGLFSRLWEKDDGSFEMGALSCFVQSNQLLSITQNC